MGAAEQLKADVTLNIETNPFASGAGHRIGRPVQMAFGEIVRQIGLETPLIIVAGVSGTGKTLLLDMTERACGDMGLSVRRVDRGDLLQAANGERTDLLLVDEAHAISDLALRTLFPAHGKGPATSIVFLCLPASTRRLNVPGVHTALVELTPLSDADAKAYLLERASHAGLPQLFGPGALEPIVYAGRGLPRMLRSIASLAYFSAASDSESQISLKHVAYALASQLSGDIPGMRDEPAASEPEGAKVAAPAPDKSPATAVAAASASTLAAAKSDIHQPPASLVQRAAGWTKRFAGIAAALAASLAIAAVIPSLLVGTSSDAVNSLNNRPVLPANYDVPKLPPRPTRPAVASVNPQSPAAAARNTGRPGAARRAPTATRPAPDLGGAASAPIASENLEPAASRDTPITEVAEPPPQTETTLANNPPAPVPEESLSSQPPPTPAAPIETATADQPKPVPPAVAPVEAVISPPPAPVAGIVGSLVTPAQVAEQARLAREAALRAQSAKDAAERAAAAQEQQTNRRRAGAFFTSMWGLAAPF